MKATATLLALLVFSAGTALGTETTGGVEGLLKQLPSASGSERAYLLYQLRQAGEEGLAATRRARDSASDPALRDALHRAAAWQLCARLTRTLRAGIDSQLTYDGQFSGLVDEEDAADVAESLLLLIDSDETPHDIRVYATRALADATPDPEARSQILPRLREIQADVLLPGALREQLAILLAIFGDTHTLVRDIRRLEKIAASTNPGFVLSSNEALATLNYRIRSYDKAVQAYDRVLELLELWYGEQKKRGASDEHLEQYEIQMALHYYNASCSNALFGDITKAKRLLKKAVELRGEHFQNIEKDGDLLPLRQDASYKAFREELEKVFESKTF